MALPGSAASSDLPAPAGSVPPAVAPVCVVKRFRKNPSGQSASVKRGGCANAQGDALVEGEAPIRASEAVGSEPGEPNYQADGVPKGRASAQGDALVEGESPIQAPKAVGSEPGEPSYQADGVPKEMGNAQSSQSRDSLRGSDPVDLVPEKPDGQPVAPVPKVSAPVGKAIGSHVQVGPAYISQARATLRGSEAEDLVPVKPDGEILSDGAAPGQVGVHLGKGDAFDPPDRPLGQPVRYDVSSAHQHTLPSSPPQGVGDAAHDRVSASKASSREVTTKARTKASHRVESEQAVRLAPPECVSGPRVHPQSDVSPASSISDAETVGAQYSEVQLGSNENQVARGGPGHGPSGPCATGREAGAHNKASSASEAITEPTGNPLGGSAKYAQLVMSPQLETPSGAISAFSLDVSRARKLDEPNSSAKAPAVSESSGRRASAGAMVDEVRPFQRRIFMGPTGVRDVPGKVSLPEKPRVVTPLSSRPVFTGPGSIPRRTECLPTRAVAYPSSDRQMPHSWNVCLKHQRPCLLVIGQCLHDLLALSVKRGSPKVPADPVALLRRTRASRRIVQKPFWPGLMLVPRVLRVIPCSPLGLLSLDGGAVHANACLPRGACFGVVGSATSTFAEIAWSIVKVAPSSLRLRLGMLLMMRSLLRRFRMPLKRQSPTVHKHCPQ
ncbi:unnamed protein product [Symbiodinium natans]|uniref:Uncharacterized protein n=1 Tax=Symbiodinium natans TaxID=878477 RepID=A0A812S9J7_9DINO|nr:unnamed protein product [Symbiodinium natans]